MCGKPPEKSTIEKVWDGIVEGTGQAVEDTVEGFKALGKWETWENMGNAALHPQIQQNLYLAKMEHHRIVDY